MIRKLIVAGAAAAIPVGLLVGGGVAFASGGVDATHATITCTTVTGSAKFKPTITKSEAAGTTTTSVKATLGGCTVSGVTATVTSGSVKGSFVSNSHAAGTNGCTALAGVTPETGSLTTKWKSSPKLTSGSSVVTVTQVTGTIASDGHGEFEIPAATDSTGHGTGSFQGSNGGANDTSNAETTQTASALLATCNASGLKSITIQTSSSGGPSAFLG